MDSFVETLQLLLSCSQYQVFMPYKALLSRLSWTSASLWISLYPVPRPLRQASFPPKGLCTYCFLCAVHFPLCLLLLLLHSNVTFSWKHPWPTVLIYSLPTWFSFFIFFSVAFNSMWNILFIDLVYHLYTSTHIQFLSALLVTISPKLRILPSKCKCSIST